jgi:hypothetical protein
LEEEWARHTTGKRLSYESFGRNRPYVDRYVHPGLAAKPPFPVTIRYDKSNADLA